ncbi:MAG TPA: hypothetical protein VFV35_00725 [Acidimicrobiales bacterium]|nr:hypothetical protein [Acidimicrobiales bacterium]
MSAGILTLMGSGETSPTMVKTHRALLERTGGPAVLLDTPFGFQSNAAELTARARQYFTDSVGHPLEVATFRSAAEIGSVTHERSLDLLRSAGYVFAGPGSPTYALRQWRPSLVPALLLERLRHGGGVTFASAAALTLGVATVPVYEIYKVGADPAWEDGLDLLGEVTGLRAAVIPHFDNAEGGTHDTRYCYLGEHRLSAMERALPEGAFVLGIDEHTGLVLDLAEATATVVGNGGVTLRWPGAGERRIEAGTACAIDDLAARPSALPSPGPAERGGIASGTGTAPDKEAASPLLAVAADAEGAFADSLSAGDVEAAAQVVLDLESALHDWSTETFSSDEMGRARATLRSMVVRLGELARVGTRDPREVVGPFVEALLDVRRDARAARRYDDADAVRDRLAGIGIEVRDTPQQTEWAFREGLVP